MRIENTHTHTHTKVVQWRWALSKVKGAKSIFWSIGFCTGGVGYKVDKFSHPLLTASKMTKFTNKRSPSFPFNHTRNFIFSQVLYIKGGKKITSTPNVLCCKVFFELL